MFTKRIIPCLDVNGGRVVKGVNFVNLIDAGDPVEIAAAYDKAGADELVFLDITASSDARNTVVDMVRKVAEKVFIPFTVGGGIRTIDDFKAILREGADKISVNSAAIMNPSLISDAADKFGSQCVVVAIDAKRRADGSGWNTAVKDPQAPDSRYAATLNLTDTACVTSGNYERFFSVDGKQYHHIIDRDTLFPAEQFASVTIITRDSGLADALSTALFCMSYEDGLALAKSLGGVEVLWINHDGTMQYTDGLQDKLVN